MRKFLPIFIFLFLVFPVSAQDISSSNSTTNISPTPNIVKSQGNIFSDIIDRLQNKQIYKEMYRINQSIMPASVVIEDETPPKVNRNDNQGEVTVETQAAKANSDTIQKVAGQYVLGTGINTPYEISKVNSNIFDWFGDFMKSITGIFNKGNEEAAKYVDLRTPEKVQNEIVDHLEEKITPTPNTKINTGEELQTDGVFGTFANSDSSTNMEKALSISRCSILPFVVCPEGELILEQKE